MVTSGGTYTFLFTDIEGSTKLLRALKEGYEAVLDEHRGLIRAAVEAEGGEEVGTEGDSFFVAFETPGAALRAAVAAQLGLTRHPWPEGGTVRVRMGLHSGEASRVPGDFVGLSVHRAARVAGAAHGGQILVSSATAALLGEALPEDVELDPLGPHHLKDFDVPEDLLQLRHPGLPSDFPPPRTEAASPTNLPVQLTSFIGREEELRAVRKLLGAARLVTLTGAGGAGKTRLAQEAGAKVLGDFPDGVWWVDLAPVTDAQRVPQEAALAAGLREGSAMGQGTSGTVLDRLARHLRPRRVLLILDNCEHLLEPCVGLVEAILGSCPEVGVLTTSREPLGVAGEATHRVASLELPDPDAPREQLATSEAVRLFCDRAQAVRDDFHLEEDKETGAVVQICRRLDGIPLAIELAAARVRSLSCIQIADRLDDRFRLLTGGSRSALPRQRTLEALVDWSHDLLSEPERVLLRRLSVFSGGFTLESAEAVCTGDGVEDVEVLDLLTALVDKSLVVVDRVGGGTRNQLLETIRQYAREKLLAAREVETLRGRHLEHFAELAHDKGLLASEGPEQVEVLERFEVEHDNFRTALEWATTTPGGEESGLRLGAGLAWFWWIRGHLTEGCEWLRRILDRHDGAASTTRARCLTGLAWLSNFRGLRREAAELAEEAVTVARASPAAEDSAYTESYAVWVRASTEDGPEARERLKEAAEVARRRGIRTFEGAALAALGIRLAHSGDREEARRLYAEALAIAREVDMRVGVLRVLAGLAMLDQEEGDLASARTMWEESLRISRELGDKIGMQISLGGLLPVVIATGAEAEVRALAEEKVALARAWGEPGIVATALNGLGYSYLMAARWQEGRDAFEEALALARTIEEPMVANILHSLGELEEACGDMAAAQARFTEALEAVPEADPSGVRGLILASLGHVLRRQGSTERARAALSEAVGIEGGHLWQALEGLGLLATGADWEAAARLLASSGALRGPVYYRAPVYDRELDEAVSRTREALGPRFDELDEEGRTMSREAAVDLALAWAGPESNRSGA